MDYRRQLMASLSCKSLTPGDVGIDSCFFNPDFKKSWVEHEYSAAAMDKTVKDMLLEDLDISSTKEKDNLVAGKLGEALCQILHICDSYQLTCCSNPNTGHNEICSFLCPSEANITSVCETGSEDFDKHAAIEYAKDLQSPRSPMGVRALLGVTAHSESYIKPATPRLLSAIKGSREQQGMLPQTKLSVKWAPDVYDPPVTSESHTVKGHHRRPKVIKKDYRKQKHGKGKSYKSISCDKKYASRKTMGTSIDYRIMRLGALHEKDAVNGHCQSKSESVDYSSITDELKHGNNFYNDSFTALHLSVAGAN